MTRETAVTKPLYDVLGVKMHGPSTVRVMGRNLTLPNAEAYIKFAVVRRGVEEEFFVETAAGAYTDGEIWQGQRCQATAQ